MLLDSENTYNWPEDQKQQQQDGREGGHVTPMTSQITVQDPDGKKESAAITPSRG